MTEGVANIKFAESYNPMYKRLYAFHQRAESAADNYATAALIDETIAMEDALERELCQTIICHYAGAALSLPDKYKMMTGREWVRI